MLVILGAIAGAVIGASAGGVIGAVIGAVVGFHLVGWVGVLLIDLLRPAMENRQPAPPFDPEPQQRASSEPEYEPVALDHEPAPSAPSYTAPPIDPALEATMESVATHLEFFGYEVTPVDGDGRTFNASHPSKLNVSFIFFDDETLLTSAFFDRNGAEISREELEAVTSINSTLAGGLTLAYDEDRDLQIMGSTENFAYDRQGFARHLETWDYAESLASDLIDQHPQRWLPEDSSVA